MGHWNLMLNIERARGKATNYAELVVICCVMQGVLDFVRQRVRVQTMEKDKSNQRQSGKWAYIITTKWHIYWYCAGKYY
jgi:hypothetical protein